MNSLIQRLKAACFVANMCFVASVLLRTPYGSQYLVGIGTTFALCAVTFGAAILLSGYHPQSRAEATNQRLSDGGPASINESRSPVSTTS